MLPGARCRHIPEPSLLGSFLPAFSGLGLLPAQGATLEGARTKVEFKTIVFTSRQAGTGQPVGWRSRLRHHDKRKFQPFGFMNCQDVEGVLRLIKSARLLGLPFTGFI